MDWLPVDDALSELNVRRQTLYAYVSRGLVRARADEGDPRRSLYSAGDIRKLRGRRRGARRRSEVAAGAIAWGEPVLESALSTVRDGQLILRGKSIDDLAAKSTLEDIACLLWKSGGPPADLEAPAKVSGPTTKARAFAMLSQRAGSDAPSLGRSGQALQRDAWAILLSFSNALFGPAKGDTIHERIASAWKLDKRGANLIRRALVLMSDHELNPSTFAVRIAASTGAPLAACALAGLSTLAGPLHGEAGARALAQLDRLLAADDVKAEVKAMIARGDHIAGWSHPLYPNGDVRAVNLLTALKPRAAIAKALAAIEKETGEKPNCDAALAAMTRDLALPDEAIFSVFAMARMTGWLAHAIEQRETGRIIRPRARYVGD
ncbi:MAG TPA: citrate synthase [Hyphomonadaceae bacterium]|nr:citrate synthase [Hyphomonadaceae bacterium]